MIVVLQKCTIFSNGTVLLALAQDPGGRPQERLYLVHSSWSYPAAKNPPKPLTDMSPFGSRLRRHRIRRSIRLIHSLIVSCTHHCSSHGNFSFFFLSLFVTLIFETTPGEVLGAHTPGAPATSHFFFPRHRPKTVAIVFRFPS